MSLQGERYATADAVNRFFDEGLDRIRRIPGVHSAAVVNGVPIDRGLNMNVDVLDGPEAVDDQITDWRYASPDYFRTMGIPIVSGRGFADADRAGAPPVAVVSEQFASRYLQGHESDRSSHPVYDVDESIEIVGVAKDLREGGLDRSAAAGDVCAGRPGQYRRHPHQPHLLSR